jgi:NADPH:quinone reductase-like Zn-dependent oxidoreductase
VQEAGADDVIVGEGVTAAARFGPYHLVVEQLGGQALADAMAQLAPGGTCVSVGVSAGPPGYLVPVDMARMRQAFRGGHVTLATVSPETTPLLTAP